MSFAVCAPGATLFEGYTYAYPHKTAYGVLEPPVALRQAWAGEPQGALFLYFHIPFCQTRCGYCNLFTLAGSEALFVEEYLEAVARQARRVREALGEKMRIARMALGGGTPTLLSVRQLEGLFGIAERLFGARGGDVPTSVEVSPATACDEKLRLLWERGVQRISLGVESFYEKELRAVGRVQSRVQVEEAVSRVRKLGFPLLNLDLIYGLPGQTMESWRESLRQALCFAPEELYLYPLYVRPQTGLGRRMTSSAHGEDLRIALYRAARDMLSAHGYRQISLRMWRAPHAPQEEGPVYCCQQDGMVGLGCGARSYTRALHYASDYAVGRAGVRAILADFVSRGEEQFDYADFGFLLDEEEQRRRWLLKTLLRCEGVSLNAWRKRFTTELWQDFPELEELEASGLVEREEERVRLTPEGVEASDAIGPCLYSRRVREAMRQWRER